VAAFEAVRVQPHVSPSLLHCPLWHRHTIIGIECRGKSGDTILISPFHWGRLLSRIGFSKKMRHDSITRHPWALDYHILVCLSRIFGKLQISDWGFRIWEIWLQCGERGARARCPWYGHGQDGRATGVFRTVKHVRSETARAKYAPSYRRRLNDPAHRWRG
jgi:hypothetical protein